MTRTVHINRDRSARMTALDLLDALVRIDSVNPGLDPAGAGEAQIAAYLARWARSAGLRADVLEGTAGRPSVIVRGGRDRGGRRLLLCGHLDTVGLAVTRDGIPTVLYGPEGEGAHADIEWVSRSGTNTVATVLTQDYCS